MPSTRPGPAPSPPPRAGVGRRGRSRYSRTRTRTQRLSDLVGCVGQYRRRAHRPRFSACPYLREDRSDRRGWERSSGSTIPLLRAIGGSQPSPAPPWDEGTHPHALAIPHRMTRATRWGFGGDVPRGPVVITGGPRPSAAGVSGVACAKFMNSAAREERQQTSKKGAF